MRGSDGDDTFAAFSGGDLLERQSGNDTLRGYADNDRLLGGDGQDLLDGGGKGTTRAVVQEIVQCLQLQDLEYQNRRRLTVHPSFRRAVSVPSPMASRIRARG
ncbi:hypothetical protein MYG64_36135 (plasmid) [Ensifer adhaerens]|uniref:hypothetical protein n=1 Tax=Ensifer adhaerens TaxID=106592 RepID=UPI002100D470|nr:hypothetical protein [Ensifer adhaerens]UTV41902.1 hypothetical protein MYG64_36135 [Ensifer adhaerens]